MEKLKRESNWTNWSVQEECLLCRITYSIYSNFPPMPSARAPNVETDEFYRVERLRSLPTGYAMAEALGYAWACKCRRRSRTPPQNLGRAQSFEYAPDAMSDDTEEFAASTNKPDYAAKMLGYDRKTFGDMVHVMKDDLDLRGDDNVIWHDTGDIEFRKNIIGNMHDYAF
ncbi:hypothetical protein [Paraburkholderia antibiotica]|nr:hypothetical protein [Paraburkholderia antibiotica]